MLGLFAFVLIVSLVVIWIYEYCQKITYIQRLLEQDYADKVARRLAKRHTEKNTRKLYKRVAWVCGVLSVALYLCKMLIPIQELSILIAICLGIACAAFMTYIIVQWSENMQINGLNRKRKRKKRQVFILK